MNLDDMVEEENFEGKRGKKKEYKIENNKDYDLVDFAHYGATPPETITERTRVVKLGKKIRK